MKLLGAAEIKAADDLPFEDVPTPEWGEGTGVRVRRLSGTEWDEFENATITFDGKQTKRDNTNFRAKLCVLAIVGENGERLFADNEAVDLGDKNIATIDRIYDAAIRLCKRRKEDMEEIAKNLKPASGEDSSSTSPVISNSAPSANCSRELMPQS